ncbi:MAG: kelch repeat-containing protein [Gemmatimonadota bacterium]
MRRFVRILPLVAAWALASCTDTSQEPTQGDFPISLSVFSGNGQTGQAGQELAQPLQVLATDGNNQPIPNQIVNFVVTSGGGSVFAGTALTNASGIAAEVWRLGTVAGQAHTVEVRAVDPDGTKHVFGVFTATVIAANPDTIVIHAGNGQTAPTGQAVPIAPAVRLADQYGNPVVNQSVTFAVTAGGGSVTGSPALTNSQGIATVGSWTLGASAGTNMLTATAAGLPSTPVTFTATSQSGTQPGLVIATAPSSTVASGSPFAQPAVIQLTAAGGGSILQAGVPVTVGLNSGGGALGGTLTVLTNSSGQAIFTNLTITGVPGARTLLFTSSGYVSVTSASINVTVGQAAAVAVNDGDNQSVNAGSAVSTNPSVLVTDASGTPVPGVTVTFSLGSGGGSVIGAVQVTDASGIARVGGWTLGATTGANSLIATVSGSGISGNPVVFNATALGNFWSARAPMTVPRRFGAFGVINELMYVAGGKDGSLTTRKTLEVYNPLTNTWTAKKDMGTARVGPMYGVINGILYVAGGNNTSGTALTTVEAYNPTTNTWTSKAPMPAAKNFGASAVINGILYVAGGATGTGSQSNTVYAYNPVTNTWSTKANLPAARNDLMATSVNGLMYVFGGQVVNTVDGAVLIYDPVANTWTNGATMPTPRFHTNVEAVNGLIYVAGGLVGNSVSVNNLEIYDPVTNTWSTGANLSIARCAAATGLIDGVIYMAGGSSGGTIFPDNEAYLP